MTPGELARCGFVDRVKGYIFQSDVQHTCVTGAGQSHIDYVLVNPAACPDIGQVRAVLDVPWGTHCGISISLRSAGKQLIT
eukprot:7574953-Pyramimonas_sp.AAC.1